jgi:hypothetical protein
VHHFDGKFGGAEAIEQLGCVFDRHAQGAAELAETSGEAAMTSIAAAAREVLRPPATAWRAANQARSRVCSNFKPSSASPAIAVVLPQNLRKGLVGGFAAV